MSVRARVARPFDYAADGINAVPLATGDELDFPSALVGGLRAAGYLEQGEPPVALAVVGSSQMALPDLGLDAPGTGEGEEAGSTLGPAKAPAPPSVPDDAPAAEGESSEAPANTSAAS